MTGAVILLGVLLLAAGAWAGLMTATANTLSQRLEAAEDALGQAVGEARRMAENMARLERENMEMSYRGGARAVRPEPEIETWRPAKGRNSGEA